MNRKWILVWELVGVILIIFAGSALHFVYEWTGSWRPIAWLAAVNESVWEHLKLAFWPAVVLAVVEYQFVKGKTHNYWLAKGFSIFIMPVVIVSGFYGYLAVAGKNAFIANLVQFTLAVLAGQLCSYAIQTSPQAKRIWHFMGVAVILVMLIAFSLLSYLPPQAFLWEDTRNHSYGLPVATAHFQWFRVLAPKV